MTGNLGELQSDDCVRAGRGLVHGGSRDGTVAIALVNLPLDLFVVGTGLFRGAVYPDLVSRLPDLEALALLTGAAEQVEDALHVNLHHLNCQLERYLLIRVRIYALEDLCTGGRNDTFVRAVAEETVRFAGTSLSVGKGGAVKTLPGLLEDACAEQLPALVLVAVV